MKRFKRCMALWMVLTVLLFPVTAWGEDTYGEHSALYGDLNLDSQIGADDALEVLRIVVGKTSREIRTLPAADVDGDGKESAADALLILKKVVGKITGFTAGEYTVVHQWGSYVEVTPATTEKDGVARRECRFCQVVDEKIIPKIVENVNDLSKQIFKLVNKERAKAGVKALTYYTVAQPAANTRAKELNELYSHTRPDGSSCFTVLEKYPWFTVGENIAMGQRTAAEVMEDWMNSPKHRENILDPDFTHFVAGAQVCTQQGYAGYTWVQLFLGLHE